MRMLLLWILACGFNSPDGPAPQIVVVKRGDTLGELAKTHGVTVQDLKRWNGLTSDLIEVGQPLEVFSSAPSPVPKGKPTKRKRRAKTLEPQMHDPSGPSAPSLPTPKAKSCLGQPGDGDLEEQDMVASEGLSHAQVQSAMDGFLPKIGSCLVRLDPRPSQALDLAITVGCDGRVTQVAIQSQGDWPDPHARCLAASLRYTPFPAHALPDGDTFHYPLRME